MAEREQLPHAVDGCQRQLFPLGGRAVLAPSSFVPEPLRVLPRQWQEVVSDPELVADQIPCVDVRLRPVGAEPHPRSPQRLDPLDAEGEERPEELQLADGEPELGVPGPDGRTTLLLDVGPMEQRVANGGMHEADVTDDHVSGMTRVEATWCHHVDDHLAGLDVSALGVAGEPGCASKRLHPLGERVVRREAGHEQPHAQLRTELAEDGLTVPHELGARPLRPALLLLHERTDSGEILIRHLPRWRLGQSPEERGVFRPGFREERGHGGVGRRVTGRPQGLDECVGEQVGADGRRDGHCLRPGTERAGSPVGLDVRQHVGSEGGLEQRGSMVPGSEQVGDEVHPVVEVDPVDRPAPLSVVVRPVEAEEQGGQVVDDHVVEVGRDECLVREWRHIVIEPQGPVRRLDGAEQPGHDVSPDIVHRLAQRVEDGIDRLPDGGWTGLLLDQPLLEQLERRVEPHVHAPGDRPLEVVLFVGTELEGSGQDELAAPSGVGLRDGVAPVGEARPQPVDPFEFRYAVARLEYLAARRLGGVGLAAEALDEGGGSRGDLGEYLGVPFREVGGAGPEELAHHVADVLGPDPAEPAVEPLVPECLVGRPGDAHHPVWSHHPLA